MFNKNIALEVKFKRLIRLPGLLLLLIILIESCSTSSSKKSINLNDGETVNFFIVADIGSNGYFQQKEVAEQMGIMSESIEPEFIISAGDCFQAQGVRSISDPLWLSNYENIYTHPGLHCDWYPVLGTGEYGCCVEVFMEYSKISRRWNFPDYYYTVVKRINDSCSLRMLFIDTTPIIEKYRNDINNYSDAAKQNYKKQLCWIDSVLSSSSERWKIVIGHHPVFSSGKKNDNNPELIELMNPLFIKHKIDAYIAGRTHNFQHIKIPDIDTEYIINSSGSFGKPCFLNDSTLFSSLDEGFTICSVSQHNMIFRMINIAGETIYQYKREKE